MQFFYDTRIDKLQAVRGGPAISRSDAVSGGMVNLRVQFVDGTQAKKYASPNIWYGFTDPSDDTVIALADTWTYHPESQSYISTLNLNTEELLAALGEEDTMTVKAQLIWEEGSNGPYHSQVIDVELDKSVIDFESATPIALPTPAEWLANALATATGKTTPVDADTIPLSDSAASDALKTLTFANLWVWIQSKFGVAPDKVTPADTDTLPLNDNAASGVVKKLTFANLQEWIEGFVAGAVTIVDNLESSATDEALSANQGRALDEAKVPLAIHQVDAITTTGLQLNGTLSTDYAPLTALLGDLLIPAPANTYGPTWSTAGIAVGGAEPSTATHLCTYVSDTLPAVWVIAGRIEGDDLVYFLWQTTAPVMSPELGTFEPVASDATGNPTVTEYTPPLVAGQMGTSDAEPNAVSLMDAEGDLRKTLVVSTNGILPTTNSFQMIPNESGGFDLALWNSDQEVFQKVSLGGESGFEYISFEA